MKKHFPATLRNRDAIADVLARELPSSGTVLEVASGSGEHAVYFAERFAELVWQPSDPDESALASIAAYCDEFAGPNLLAPIALDASDPNGWRLENADAILCCNMVHISPWKATEGLFEGAANIMPSEGKLLLYGPYFEAEVVPAESNLAFDAGLRQRNPDWGIRQLGELDKLAGSHGLVRSARYEMPANNLTLAYRRF